MSAIDNGTYIGKKHIVGKVYYVLVEYRNKDDEGIDVEVVCETRSEQTATIVKDSLNEMLKRGIFDSGRVIEFYIDEDDVDDSTVVADSLLTDLLTADKRFYGDDDPIRALLKVIYALENQV